MSEEESYSRRTSLCQIRFHTEIARAPQSLLGVSEDSRPGEGCCEGCSCKDMNIHNLVTVTGDRMRNLWTEMLKKGEGQHGRGGVDLLERGGREAGPRQTQSQRVSSLSLTTSRLWSRQLVGMC